MLPRTKLAAEEWLKRAKSNLARANAPKPSGAYWEDLCFDAQQAAEKALKALFVWHSRKFPYSHDIAALLVEMESFIPDIPANVRQAVILSDYAVATRYPSWGPPVTEDEFKVALGHAQSVVEWVGKNLV
jgi:HEPN domain-containing protein